MPEVYRADHVGSLLRPADLHQARANCREGMLELHQLRAIEDAAILHVLERQQAAGVEIYTDGEFRRSGFQNDLIEAVEGYVETNDPAVVRVWQGPGGEPHEQGTRQVVGGKLRQLRRLTQYQATFMNAYAPGPFKITVPSPSQYPAISFQPGLTDRYYPTRSDLLWDIAEIIKAEISALLESGVPYVQIDAPRYSYYVDAKWREHLRELGGRPGPDVRGSSGGGHLLPGGSATARRHGSAAYLPGKQPEQMVRGKRLRGHCRKVVRDVARRQVSPGI